VHAGGDALDREFGQLGVESGEKPVSTPPVDPTRPPNMPVVVAAGDEESESQLVDRRRADIQQVLDAAGLLDERGRHDQPAEAERRRERLRGRTEIDHPFGIEALERAHGLTVVAEL